LKKYGSTPQLEVEIAPVVVPVSSRIALKAAVEASQRGHKPWRDTDKHGFLAW